jgi:hypothetical protein
MRLCIVLGSLVIILLATRADSSPSRAQRRDAKYAGYPSPDGKWLALENPKSGALFVQATVGRVRRTPLPIGFLLGAWSPDSEQLVLFAIPKPGQTTVMLYAVRTKKERRFDVVGVPAGRQASFSPDSRYFASRWDLPSTITNSILIGIIAPVDHQATVVVPFRHTVSGFAWADSTHLFLITSGRDLPEKGRQDHFLQECFLLEVPIPQSRPVSLPSDVRISSLAEYADAHGDVIMVVRHGKRYSLARWNPVRGKVEDIKTLDTPELNDGWSLLWRDPKKLVVIWRYGTRVSSWRVWEYNSLNNSLSDSRDLTASSLDSLINRLHSSQ